MLVSRSLGRTIGRGKVVECGRGTIAAMPISTTAAAARTSTPSLELISALALRIRCTRTCGGVGVDNSPGGSGAGIGGKEVGKDTTAPTRTTSTVLRATTSRTRVRFLAVGEIRTRSVGQICRRHPRSHLHLHYNHQVKLQQDADCFLTRPFPQDILDSIAAYR